MYAETWSACACISLGNTLQWTELIQRQSSAISNHPCENTITINTLPINTPINTAVKSTLLNYLLLLSSTIEDYLGESQVSSDLTVLFGDLNHNISSCYTGFFVLFYIGRTLIKFTIKTNCLTRIIYILKPTHSKHLCCFNFPCAFSNMPKLIKHSDMFIYIVDWEVVLMGLLVSSYSLQGMKQDGP